MHVFAVSNNIPFAPATMRPVPVHMPAISCDVDGYTGADASCSCAIGYAGAVSYAQGAPIGCAQCVGGQYQGAAGQPSCIACAEGKTSLDGAAACWQCCVGRYKDEVPGVTCKGLALAVR